MKRYLLLLALSNTMVTLGMEQEKTYYQILGFPFATTSVTQKMIGQRYQEKKQELDNSIASIQREIDNNIFSKDTKDFAEIYEITDLQAAQKLIEIDEEELERIKEAYEILSDPEKRKQYDEELKQQKEKEQQQQKQEYKQKISEFNKDLETFLETLANANLATQKQSLLDKLNDLGDRLSNLQAQYTGYEIQPQDDLLWALQDVIKKEKTYLKGASHILSDDITKALQETDPTTRFESLNKVLFTEGLTGLGGGKFGGVYWLIYDKTLANNVFTAYLDILDLLANEKNKKVLEVLAKLNEIQKILGKNFSVNPLLKERLNRLAEQIKPVPPPKRNPLQKLHTSLSSLVKGLEDLNKALAQI